jgi:hypothetical protein
MAADDIQIEHVPRENAVRVRLGSYEFKKKGISRFGLRDPYQSLFADGACQPVLSGMLL